MFKAERKWFLERRMSRSSYTSYSAVSVFSRGSLGPRWRFSDGGIKYNVLVVGVPVGLFGISSPVSVSSFKVVQGFKEV